MSLKENVLKTKLGKNKVINAANIKSKVKTAAGIATAGAMMAMSSVTALAGQTLQPYDGASADSIMSGAKNLFATIGTYGGGLYAIVAIFTLILAVRNEDNEGRNKAILNLLAAILLLSTGVILNMFMV